MSPGQLQELETTDLHLIHDGTLDLPVLQDLAPERRIIGLDWSQRETPPAESRVLLYLTDDRLRELAPLIVEHHWEVGVLPHPEAVYAGRALGLKGDVASIFAHYLQVQSIEADVLTCNDQQVLSSVVIGEVLDLNPYEIERPASRRDAFLGALKAVRHLRLRSYTLTTGNEQEIRLAALGMVVLEHTQSTLIGRSFSDALSISDRRLTLLALAPRSVLSYLGFLLRLLLPKKINLSRLPTAVGLIRSTRILLKVPRGVDYRLDGSLQSAKEIDFRISDQPIRLLPGPALAAREDAGQAKDTMKLNHLPVGQTAVHMVEKPLPFFSHASEEEYRDLFVSLRENAALSSPFLVLMILSVLLALTGLYANSAPVIIGAMILAPLMSPIISLSMGLARTQPALIRNSLRTLTVGIGVGFFCAVSAAWLVPLENLTPEMQARLSPTLLDLSVAVISGIAGAYAHAKEDVAKSLAGVAIAVALVPPLSVAGIGFGWGDWAMAKGASLLFTTNLFGIALAASATFLVMGFAPFKLAKKGLAIALLLTAGITAPLSIAFDDLVEEGRILEQIPAGQIQLAGQRVDLRVVKVQAGTPPVIRIVLSSPKRLDESHVDVLKQMIGGHLGRPVVLEAQLNLRR